jgi:hypothetical protein
MQTIRYAIRRAARQTARNIKYGFSQRNVAVHVPGSTVTAMVRVLNV